MCCAQFVFYHQFNFIITFIFVIFFFSVFLFLCFSKGKGAEGVCGSRGEGWGEKKKKKFNMMMT